MSRASSSSSSSSDTSSEEETTFLDKEYYAKRLEIADMEEFHESDDYQGDEDQADMVKELADLPTDVPEGARLELFGEIYAKMEPFIVVSPASSFAVLDIGSAVICPETRKIIGKVWDVFGPVKRPMYSLAVRPEYFADATVGLKLYFSPDLVQLVSKDSLAQEKGIDADPNQDAEFSDDEQERLHKKGKETGEIN